MDQNSLLGDNFAPGVKVCPRGEVKKGPLYLGGIQSHDPYLQSPRWKAETICTTRPRSHDSTSLIGLVPGGVV
jgi:hypothetical protein